MDATPSFYKLIVSRDKLVVEVTLLIKFRMRIQYEVLTRTGIVVENVSVVSIDVEIIFRTDHLTNVARFTLGMAMNAFP